MVANDWSIKIMVASTYNKPTSNNLNYKKDEYIRCTNNTGDRRFVVLQNNTAIGIPIEYNEVYLIHY